MSEWMRFYHVPTATMRDGTAENLYNYVVEYHLNIRVLLDIMKKEQALNEIATNRARVREAPHLSVADIEMVPTGQC